MTYLFITRRKDSAALVFCFSYIITWCIKSTFVPCLSPGDHNENKVFLDLYYAIPVKVCTCDDFAAIVG